MNKLTELLTKRAEALNSVAELDKEIKSMEKIIYKGKFDKALRLLKECLPYLRYETAEFECECDECGHTNYFDVDFEEIYEGLEEQIGKRLLK